MAASWTPSLFPKTRRDKSASELASFPLRDDAVVADVVDAAAAVDGSPVAGS